MNAASPCPKKVELVRFPDECEHGERVCIVPAERKNRPCTAVAWDPENPTRLAAAWTKVCGVVWCGVVWCVWLLELLTHCWRQGGERRWTHVVLGVFCCFFDVHALT